MDDYSYGPSGVFSRRQVRPVPYYTVPGTSSERRLAAALRATFVPQVRRRLPEHHLCGQRHDWVVRFVERHKARYPYFLTGDIRLFYATVRHEDVVTYLQIAYRDLCRLEYVPRRFKERFVGPVAAWLRELPVRRGLPVGSALSGILAPVMLVPLWLSVKRLYRLPLLVYMDDFLLCAQSAAQCAEVYAYIDRYLTEMYDLELNREKSRSGRFATGTATFCGWQFAGGYARIATAKSEAFRERIREVCRRTRKPDTTAFIKRINRKIDGFGHYYKFGHVRAEYRALDRFVRGEVRRWFERTHGVRLYHVERLSSHGLRTLEGILGSPKEKARSAGDAGRRLRPVALPPAAPQGTATAVAAEIEAIRELLTLQHKQQTQLLALARRQCRLLERLLDC